MPSHLPKIVQSIPVPPFFERGTPPPPFPVLTSQVDFLENQSPTPALTVLEELVPRRDVTPVRTLPVRRRATPAYTKPRVVVKSRSRTPRSRTNSPAPAARKSTRTTRSASRGRSTTPADVSDSDSDSDSEPDPGSPESSEEVEKVPKPAGEATRPGRGGYTLEVVLGWHPKVFAKIKKSVFRLVDQHLDVAYCYSKQKRKGIKAVCDGAVELYPALDDYEKVWPVTDMIKQRLKYTSDRHRKAEKAEEEAASKIMDAVRGEGSSRKKSRRA